METHPSIAYAPDAPTIQPLPAEILLRILMALRVVDVLTCKMVSRYFNNIIANSVQLQYRIELAVASYVDTDTASTWSSAEKLDRLRTLQKNWDNLSFSSATVPAPLADDEFDYEDGLYVSAEMGGYYPVGSQVPPLQINLVEMPLRPSGHSDTWVNRSLTVEGGVLKFGIFVEHDLLVMICGQPNDSQGPEFREYSTFRILFRTLSTAVAHPMAKKPQLVHNPAEPVEIEGMTLEVAEDRVGVLFWNQIKIWNWHTGHLIGVLTEITVPFAFLDPYHIAVALRVQDLPFEGPSIESRPPNALAIGVFEIPFEGIDDENISDLDQLRCDCIANFGLPRTLDEWTPNFATCQSRPPPAHRRAPNPQQAPSISMPINQRNNRVHLLDVEGTVPGPASVPTVQQPFKVDPARRIVSVTINFEDARLEDVDTGGWSLTLLTLDSIFLNRISQMKSSPRKAANSRTPSDCSASGIKSIPWSDWSAFARCFIAPPRANLHPDDSWIWYTFGLRAAFFWADNQAHPPQGPSDPTTEFTLKLLDFNQAAVRKHTRSILAEEAVFEKQDTSIPQPNKPVISTRPILVAKGDRMEYPNLFLDPLVCGSELPYRVTTSNTSFYGMEGGLLGGDRLVQLHVANWSDVEEGPMPEADMAVLML